MASLQDLTNKIKQLFQGGQQVASNVGQQVQSLPQQFQASAQLMQQGWNSRPQQPQPLTFRPATESLGYRTQQAVLQPFANLQQTIMQPPQFNFSQNVQNPVAKFGAGLAEGVLNQPGRSIQAAGRVGTDIRQGTMTPQRFIGNAAEAAMLPLSFVGGGGAVAGVGKQILRPSLTQAAKTMAIQGTKYGAGFGALQGLANNKEAPNIGAQIVRSAPETLVGAALGGVTGGALGGLANLPKATIIAGVRKLFPKATPQEVALVTDNYVRSSTTGRFMKDNPQWIGETTQRTQNMLDQGKWPTKSIPKINSQIDEYLKNQLPQPGMSVKYVNNKGNKVSGLEAGVKPSVTSRTLPPTQLEKPILPTTPTMPILTNTGLKVSNPPINNVSNLSSTQDYIRQLQQEQKTANNVNGGGLITKSQGVMADVKRKLVDSTAPIEDILASVQKKGKFAILPSKNVSPQIDRAIRSRELAGQFLKDNGMVDVIKQVPDTKTLDQYLIAKHAPEVTTVTGRNAQADAKLVQDLAPTYEPFAQKVVQYGQNLLDYMTQTGLVSKDIATMLKQEYPNYVPLNRIFNELEKAIVPEGVGKGVASLSKQTVVQGLKGSERAIVNPTESLLTKTVDAFSQGERNQAGQMLASYKDLPGNPFSLRELKPGESAVNTISYLDNGVKKTFETTPEIAQAAKFLDKRQLGLIGQIFATPVRVARVGITGVNIPFIASNIAKDQVSLAINSDHALQTSIIGGGGQNFLKSLWTAVGHGAEYDNWIRNAGGGTSFDISRSAPSTSIAQIRAGKNIGSQIAYTVTHPGQLLRTVENIVSRGEELTRLQSFQGTRNALIKEGRTVQDANILAAKASRENTVNFGRSGDWGKALNSVFLYMNAGIQGSRTLLRNLQTRPLQTAAKIGITVFTPVAAVTAWNMSDPQRLAAYNDIRDFEKENNLVIIPANPTKDANGKWNVIKIPFSQEIANLTIPVRKGIEALQGADGPSFTDVAAALLGTTTSLNTQSPNALVGQFIPQAVKPPMEAILNKNLFTGTDIVPQYLNGKMSKTLPPNQQVQDNTSGTARKIGGVLNTSPIKVEQFIKSAAGGVGSQVINASDQALATTGQIPQNQVGGQSISQGLTSRFTQATGGQDLSNLYSKIDEANNKGTQLDLNQQVVNNGKVYYPTIVQHKDGTKSYTLSSDPATGLDTTSGSTNIKLASNDVYAGIDPLIKKYFPQDQWNNAQAVMMAESSGNSNAVGDSYPINGQTIPSYGKFQIRALPGRPDSKTLLNPEENVKYAAQLYAQEGWQPWTAAQKLGIVNGGQVASTLQGQYMITDPATGNRKQIDFSTPITAPTKTGLLEVDKLAISKYNSAITARVNDIYSLYKDGQLTADEANTEIAQLKSKSISTAKGKAPKKVTFKALPKPKAFKFKVVKAKKPTTFKIAKAPTFKLTKPKKSIFKLAKIKTPAIKGILKG